MARRISKKNEKKKMAVYPDGGKILDLDSIPERPYFVEKHGKKEIHNYGNLRLISKDIHGCGMEEGWIPTYTKKNGKVVKGHCSYRGPNCKPYTMDEIHAIYKEESPESLKEIIEDNKKYAKEYRAKKRSMR